MDTKETEPIVPVPTCSCIIEKQAGASDDVLCGKPASCQWPIFADDGETILDLIFACPHHEQRYDDGHTLLAKDMRGFVHMFGLEPGKYPEDEALTSSPPPDKIDGE